MGNKRLLELAIFFFFASVLKISNGCRIGGGVTIGPVPHQVTILDTLRGNILSETTTDIERLISVNYGGALVSTVAYLAITHENNQLIVRTSDAFDQYEANEVAENFSANLIFECAGGSTSLLTLVIHITDTNNNYPEFLPTNTFDFDLTAPVPPGFLLTGCLNEIIVRDIDLTTRAIIFEIEDNPYFEIEYDTEPCPAPGVKQYKARLRTSTFIRNFRDAMTLRVTATDMDATSDPPLSSSGTIRISGDPQFEFPEEPVFSQTLYFASYTEGHQLILPEPISLQQGFDENVNFDLDGEYKDNFDVSPVGNQVTLIVSTPLTLDTLDVQEIYLIVRADKEFTSGGSATIVIRLPEVTPLSFESAQYRGSIVDNSLQLLPLVLSGGYEGVTVSAEVVGEYATSFTATVQGNLVTVIMSALADHIIEANSFIPIQVVASTGRNQATTIVTLEIIKEDSVTPAFDKAIYTGSYDPTNGLNIEEIAFVQGFDETVEVDLLGEHRDLFQLNDIGPIIRLTSAAIPPELFEEQRITLSIVASKPRTVGANAAIVISLPSPRSLNFEEDIYKGTIHDGRLALPSILLSSGYDASVSFNLGGDYSTYFNVSNEQNQVTIYLPSPLPDDVITQNTVIILTLTASGINAITTTTSVVLDVIKEDTTTPVFSQNIYYGTYRGASEFEIENIFLSQGFNDEVSFKLDGTDHAQYFDISNTENSATITLRTAIPEDVIFSEKVLLFSVLADKAFTVGSNAAVLIRFPTELTESAVMKFSQNYYIGAYEDSTVLLDDIILNTGYATGTNFVLDGDHADHFIITYLNNNIVISSNDTNYLPPEIIADNEFIILTVEARRERAVSVMTTVIIDIVKEFIVNPVFNQAYYRGSYNDENELEFTENINILEGYEETIIFVLEGEQSTWFRVTNDGNSVTLHLDTPIPEAILDYNNHLMFSILALNVNGGIGRSVISIDVTRDNTLSFSRDYYKGRITEGIPTLELLSIDNFIIPDTTVPALSGDYSDYFQVINVNGNLQLELINTIPDQILQENKAIVLTLEIKLGNAKIRTFIILEIDSTDIVLTFESTYYVGSYSTENGLEFEDTIRTIDVDFDKVQFNLEGDDAQWFDLEREQNSVKLILKDTIPPTSLLGNQLIFVVIANIPDVTTTRATIIVSIRYPDILYLGFDRVSYVGSIENDQTYIGPITLSEGYVPGVVFELHGELRDYFRVTSQEALVTVTLQTPIPEQSIPANGIIPLDLQASAPQSVSAFATLVFKYVVDVDTKPAVELIFAQTYYTGSYTEVTGLEFITPISLADGYDENVQFVIEGDQGQWFSLAGPPNSRTLILSSPIPTAVLLNNQQLVFAVNAQRTGSTTTGATIVISLPSEHNETLVLGFDRVSYVGSIENDQTYIGPITLSEGYVPGVVFELHGELRDYFRVTSQEALVTVTLQTPLPEQSIPANGIIPLDLQASAPQSVSAFATLVFKYVVDVDTKPAVELIFAQTYYTGSYTEVTGLEFITPISLADGYDENVQFVIEGDQGQWFSLAGPPNSRTLILSSPIPTAVLLNNQQLVFAVNAQRTGSTTTGATIVISLPSEHNENLVLGFDRVSYVGSIENDQTYIGPITLSEGYVPGVVFELHGELRDYFRVTSQEALVTVTLQTPIPEQSIPANGIIPLDLQASAPQSVSAFATLVFKYVVDVDTKPAVELIFAQTYYTGSYTEVTGLEFITPISLAAGYDENVQFVIEGDQGQWFSLAGPPNSRTLILSSPIPTAVLLNNQQLVFAVNAQRTGSTTTGATIVISLPSEHNQNLVLGFDRVSYVGSIENDQTYIGPITLSEGYVPGVVFELHGELRDYFRVTSQEALVTVTLQTPLPEQSIPANGIIPLDLQASAPQSVSAFATLVFKYVVDVDTKPAVELIFAQTYYTGSYTEVTGLEFITPISLADGYDENVQFIIEGDQGQWFSLAGPPNSRTLILSSPIPTAVLLNNQQLVFAVNAQRTGSTTTGATIVISLPSEHNETLVLGFDRVSYVGSIENDQTYIGPITLSEGYVPGVVFELHGELRDYFRVTSQEALVTVTLQTPIPEQSIPANGIIPLDLQASAPQSVSAFATLVFKYVVDVDTKPAVELIFAQTYYTGSYTEVTGLEFITPISLADGYDENVQFVIEGDQGQWFSLAGPPNSRTLILSSPIPTAVLLNNQQLVFAVNAQRTGSTTTGATIVISLPSEHNENLVLGFDRVSYVGSIENDQTYIGPITLSEGYVPGVVFELHGELRDYFRVTSQEALVTVTLQTPIPEQSIPANGIIPLDLQASAPQSVSAFATLVFKYVVDVDTKPAVELIFAQTYYTGSYTEVTGLEFITPISLAAGYDENVQFVIEGDQGQWFSLAGPPNSRTLILSSPIPTAVLLNNQQLVFAVNAQRTGSTTTGTTIVISLPSEHNQNLVLGFDRVSYVGSIENDQTYIGPITLSEGYVPGVVFELHGELRDYFRVTSQEALVTVTLQTPLPEQSIPANGIIPLDLQASAPQTVSAFATLVFKYVVDVDTKPGVELIFAQTYYTGSYTEVTGLEFITPISLADGYDENVQFIIEGDQGQWFSLAGPPNSRTLILSSPIPTAVLLNNQQLVFAVNAQRTGSTTTGATIVISLPSEHNETLVLGFDRVSYVGSIENDQTYIGPITLSEGYVPGVVFELHGELRDYFRVTSQEALVTVTLQTPIPEQSIPANGIIPLDLQASAPQSVSAFATLVFKYVVDVDTKPAVELIFAQTYYTGSYTEVTGLEFITPISLADGYDENVQFIIEGDQGQWFSLAGPPNSRTLILSSPIPTAVLLNNQQLVFAVNAQRTGSTTTGATIVIALPGNESQTGSDESFEKVLFEGVLLNGVVNHETITVTGFTGSNIELFGEYSTLFGSEVTNGEVTIRATGTLPVEVTYLAVELHAGSARAVLLLDVETSDVPTQPVTVVSFTSLYYAIQVTIADSGLVGRVEASADNGEDIRYSLQLDNGHLQERLSINDAGELHLSAPVSPGMYTFHVVATTVNSLQSGTAVVDLTSEAITTCEGDIVMPPLIVLERDEEQPHYDLINSNEGCHFRLTNRWPLEQTWLFVDETGLHTTSIDREDASIAFMAVSQVQVEITLHCEIDETRTKRSLSTRPDSTEYGSNRWVLTESIAYNSRRSLVNLIVHDINDNWPVFVGKTQEPIVVGYPVTELEERVLPRSLAELQATDADIGENAELLYWSSEPVLAVAPTTGFVHVRDGATLEHDARLTVNATDRNGHEDGLTGSIDILVKLLDESNIAVVTVRDAFLDNESDILARLSTSVGYEIKVLRSVVISDDEANEATRKKRDVTSAKGASLQLYVYGLIEREPVTVERLTTDITNAVIAQVTVASTVSLGDHLSDREICVISGRDTGLLVATIILSVLLFIIIVLILVWFFLRWRKNRNYNQFSDASSLASRIDTPDQFPKPVEVVSKPRLNIEELKKSERRLQEMLDAPMPEVTVEPTPSRKEAVLNMSTPQDPSASIVIQSIDKLKTADDSSDDEYGEIKRPNRKSVVTFNENVEKIIHVEDVDAPLEDEKLGYEIYKF